MIVDLLKELSTRIGVKFAGIKKSLMQNVLECLSLVHVVPDHHTRAVVLEAINDS